MFTNPLISIYSTQASGITLVDAAAPSFLTGDLFLTESYLNGVWYRDQGIATYQGAKYAIQLITFVTSSATATITFPDYLNPYSTLVYSCLPFTALSTANAVQLAIEKLSNVDSVDVNKYVDSNGYTVFSVTFLSNFGIVPLFISGNSGVVVSEMQAGIAEIQAVTLASDTDFK